MAVSCEIKLIRVKQLTCVMQEHRKEFDSPDMFHPENALAIFYMTGMDFIFLLKLRELTTYNITSSIIAKHVDIYSAGDTKCARVLRTFLLLLCIFNLDKLCCITLK